MWHFQLHWRIPSVDNHVQEQQSEGSTVCLVKSDNIKWAHKPERAGRTCQQEHQSILCRFLGPFI